MSSFEPMAVVNSVVDRISPTYTSWISMREDGSHSGEELEVAETLLLMSQTSPPRSEAMMHPPADNVPPPAPTVQAVLPTPPPESSAMMPPPPVPTTQKSERLYNVKCTLRHKKRHETERHAIVDVLNYNFQPFYNFLASMTSPPTTMLITFNMRSSTRHSLDTPLSSIERVFGEGLAWLCMAAYRWPGALRDSDIRFKWTSMLESSTELVCSRTKPKTHKSDVKKQMEALLAEAVVYGMSLAPQQVVYFTPQSGRLCRQWVAAHAHFFVSELCPEGALVLRKAPSSMVVKKKEEEKKAVANGVVVMSSEKRKYDAAFNEEHVDANVERKKHRKKMLAIGGVSTHSGKRKYDAAFNKERVDPKGGRKRKGKKQKKKVLENCVVATCSGKRKYDAAFNEGHVDANGERKKHRKKMLAIGGVSTHSGKRKYDSAFNKVHVDANGGWKRKKKKALAKKKKALANGVV